MHKYLSQSTLQTVLHRLLCSQMFCWRVRRRALIIDILYTQADCFNDIYIVIYTKMYTMSYSVIVYKLPRIQKGQRRSNTTAMLYHKSLVTRHKHHHHPFIIKSQSVVVCCEFKTQHVIHTQRASGRRW